MYRSRERAGQNSIVPEEWQSGEREKLGGGYKCSITPIESAPFIEFP
jgi:hypothetical protein